MNGPEVGKQLEFLDMALLEGEMRPWFLIY
jgi:hypothetical protein